MFLTSPKIYFIRYDNFHVDRFPFLYVLGSNRLNTFGFNVHYLPKLFAKKNFKYKMHDVRQSLLMLERYRKHPALKLFFNFVESDKFVHYSYKARKKILFARWPGILNITYRHYKNKHVKIVWTHPKKTIEEAILEIKKVK